MAKPGKDGKKFEKRLADLEKIVSRLESGESPLEESLVLFEEGTRILKELTLILDEAERRVEILSQDVSGRFLTEPLEEAEEE